MNQRTWSSFFASVFAGSDPKVQWDTQSCIIRIQYELKKKIKNEEGNSSKKHELKMNFNVGGPNPFPPTNPLNLIDKN